ncbi:helix-turn-helix domain-containing protein, partial [Streptomyces sp. NPDC052196]|uniref:helix-turn-helix domain-containing protein n=1 Tax=Streptomyces sp. NPDC052196 TaxID=3156691 RepID=UPI00341BC403
MGKRMWLHDVQSENFQGVKVDDQGNMARSPAWSALSEDARALRAQLRTGQPITQASDALDELVAAGLVKYDPHNDMHFAVDLAQAGRAHMRELHDVMRSHLTDLESVIQLVTDSESAIGTESAGQSVGVERIPHHAEVTTAVIAHAEAATSHIYTAHPIARTTALVRNALRTDLGILQRGISLRVIYLDSARTRPPEQEYAAEVSKFGGQVRTAVPPFERMVVIDDRVVFLSDPCGDPDDKPALMITHPSLVALFVSVYQQQWDAAEPWMGEMRSADESVFTPRARRILQRLRDGWNFKQIASELDVSPSTVYGDMERLYIATGTDTQFALGAWMESPAGR